MVKRCLVSLACILVALFLMTTSVGATSTPVTNGPFAGCSVSDNHVVTCPAGYAIAAMNPYYGLSTYPYNLGFYGYGTVAPVLRNVVYAYTDNRYCDGVVYVTNEGGNLIDRCDTGVRVFPLYPDYVVPYPYGYIVPASA